MRPEPRRTAPPGRGGRALMALAVLNVLLHCVGLALMAWALRPGSPLVPFDSRRRYLAQAPWGWTAGWGALMLCALALVAFCAALARLLRSVTRMPELARLAVVIAVAGAAVDLLCDTIQIAVLPRLSAEPESGSAVLLAFERLAGAGGLVVANGAYSVAVLLLTFCLHATRPAPRLAVGLGYLVFALGMVLVVAGLLDWAWLAAIASAPTLLGFCAWCVLTAVAVPRAEPCA